MAGSNFVDKQKVLKFISSIPFTADDRQKWQASLEENEVDEALLNEIHEKLMEIPQEKFASDWMKLKYITDLKQLIQQWRMHNSSRQFRHGR